MLEEHGREANGRLRNHYNQTRADYQRRLDEASRTLRDGHLAFIGYAVRGFVEGLQEQLALIRQQQFDDRWEQYVYESFGEANTATQSRRRQLVLDLSEERRPVPRAEMTQLSPALAAAHAQKTSKTVSRDLNALREMDLIRHELFKDERSRRRVGYVPRRELIEAFLPISAGDGGSAD